MPPAVLRSAAAVSALQCISLLSAGDPDFLVETLEISALFPHLRVSTALLAQAPPRWGRRERAETFQSEQHRELLCIDLDLIFVTVQYLMKTCRTAELRGETSLPRLSSPAPARADLLPASVGAGTEVRLSQTPGCF